MGDKIDMFNQFIEVGANERPVVINSYAVSALVG